MARNVSIGSTTSRKKIQQHLRDFNFKTLFVEDLGWDILKEPPLTIPVGNAEYTLRPLVEKRGVKVFVCDPDASGHIPADSVLRKIEREVTRQAAYEQFIIFTDAAREQQVWLWVKREQGKRTAARMNRYHKGQSGELLAQKLERLAVRMDEEERLNMAEVVGRVVRAFDVERVTKKFYDRFKLEHAAFLKLIQGIEEQAGREWYASLMLNRLMFIYFIQRKGFLDTQEPGKLDGDPNYLSNRLKMVRAEQGEDLFHTFYRYFLVKLFHDGLSQRDHSPELEKLLGRVPYLNGGLFDVHVLERLNPKIDIPDEAFVRLFTFFDEFDWHLDDRPLHNDREINPDVLGYIFEKYINQKQMGAYYTKEDITEYISKNTILPFILDAAEQKCLIAFRPDGPVWMLLRENPDVYIYDAVKKGCELPLPPEIEAGVHDVTQREAWNRPAPEAYALPTETWREVVARRTRYQEVRNALQNEQITSVNDLITYNLDIRHFAEDVITYCTSTDLLRALYDSIAQVTILDPTCGSGAFLFAALTILEGLYEACLERMQDLVEERAALDAALPAEKRRNHPDLLHFRSILEQVGKHPNRAYFIYKSIIINNLYGVDIMEEATEICKLRLFLKLVSQIEKFDDIEPLPDIDFNIRAGNTLVGFASHEETKQAIEGKAVGKGGTKGEVAIQSQMIFDDRLDRIEQKAQEIERAFEHFRALQTTLVLDSSDLADSKRQLREMLNSLRTELDGYLASEYGINRENIPREAEYKARFAHWQQSHQPFHWWVEFYGIMKRGGFDVIIGNPPWIEYRKVSSQYAVYNIYTRECNNLWAFTVEQSLNLLYQTGRCGLIVPMSLACSERMLPIQEKLRAGGLSWISNYESDTHPGQLFNGVQQNVSILLHLAGVTSKQYTTRLYRFFSEARDFVFFAIQYNELIHNHLNFGFAKISEKIEVSILEKLFAHRRLNNLLAKKDGLAIYVHRIAHYYIKCFDFIPYFKSERDGIKKSEDYKTYVFSPPLEPFVAIINSSIFYFYWQIFFDSFKAGKQCVEGFPCNPITDALLIEKLTQYCHVLMNDLQKNAKRLSASYSSTGNVEYDQFFSRKSKPIMDEIDRLLAQHYGFTVEEVDFIINYDIKYRTEKDDGAEEE